MFLRLSKSVAEADDYINNLALAFIDRECCDGSVAIDELITLHDALISRVLSLICERECCASPERVHIESIIELCKKAVPHSSISLPNKAMAKIEEGRLIFINEDELAPFEDFEIPFQEGKVELSNGILINVEKNPTEKMSPNSIFVDVKCDCLNDKARFRSKKDGDVIFAGNMNKKVKKLLNEKKIPLAQRKKLPILVLEDEILWIPTVAVCDRIKRDKIKDGEDFFRITITL
jgi:tRNA(Ile)-lysidine synthase